MLNCHRLVTKAVLVAGEISLNESFAIPYATEMMGMGGHHVSQGIDGGL